MEAVPEMSAMVDRLARVRAQIDDAAGQRPVHLVAVSKSQPASALRALFDLGQRVFGENYLQEAIGKQQSLGDLPIEWHLIGALQSNKCRDTAQRFDWVQTVDRGKLVPLLARERDPARPPLNLLVQVNISGEGSKSGCSPDAVAEIAGAIAEAPNLRLRGLMAIPAPWPDAGRRRDDFARMRSLFEGLRQNQPQVDTLSMGMSEDYALAIGEGATMVRIGSALFGARGAPSSTHELGR